MAVFFVDRRVAFALRRSMQEATQMAFSPAKIAAALGAALLCGVRRGRRPGALDPTFGSGGKVTTAIGISAFASGVVVQPEVVGNMMPLLGHTPWYS